MGYSKRRIVLTEDQRRYLLEYTAKGIKPVQIEKVVLRKKRDVRLREIKMTGDVEALFFTLCIVMRIKKTANFQHRFNKQNSIPGIAQL